MRARDCFYYLFGNANAIRAVASSRGALPTGIVLVLLTAIARNYDQTFIGENPYLWLLGSLLFSCISGYWLYAVTYGGFARRWMAGGFGVAPVEFTSGSRSFMGLFWMTAPIAWLYAIPVERFLDSVEAAKANVTLLGVVSLWRVVLMARVLSVTCRVSPVITLGWVLVAATVEVMAVAFFGGGVGKRIAAAMGGMRNSPAEDVLLHAASTACSMSFFTAPVALILSMLARPKEVPTPLPVIAPGGAVPWKALAALAVFWILVAIHPQMQTRHSAQVDALAARGEWREMLDYLSAHQPGDFPPSRSLPPKPFERSLFRQFPEVLSEVQETDAPWVRQHVVRRLDELRQHLGPRWGPHRYSREETETDQLEQMTRGFKWYWHSPIPGPWATGLNRLKAIPEGRAWLATNSLFINALANYVAERPWARSDSPEPDWNWLAWHLKDLGATNSALTNLLSAPPPPSARTNAAPR